MIAHDGLDVAAVFVLHLVSDTRAAVIRRDGPDTDTDTDIDTDPTSADVDDPTVTVTATATATPTGNAASASSSTTGTSSLSTGVGSSSGVHLDQGVKAGIAIGVIVGVFFIAGAIFMIFRRWLRNRRAKRLGPQDPNNPAMRNIPPPAGGAAGYSAEDKRSTITTISGDGGTRPWFDTGVGSTELEARDRRGKLGPPSWVEEKAELPTPRRDRTVELPDAVGTRFEPVELPAAMPLMRDDRNQGDVADRLGMAGVRRSGSQNTWTTGTMSSFKSGTLVPSPTGTTGTDEGNQGVISPCSTGSDYNRPGKIGV